MPFKPGQSGNPKGRPPKGEATAEILRAIGDLTYNNTEKTYRERAAQVLWEQACKGNLAAFQWIVDRTEGKVTDRLQHELSVSPVTFIPWARRADVPADGEAADGG